MSLVIPGQFKLPDPAEDPNNYWVWLDPNDPSTMWQDTAQTTPVTKDGDPIEYMRDKSTSGNHFQTSQSPFHPFYRTDGSKSWIEISGANTRGLTTVGRMFPDSTVATVVMCFSHLDSTDNNSLFVGTSATGRYAGVIQDGSSSGLHAAVGSPHYRLNGRRVSPANRGEFWDLINGTSSTGVSDIQVVSVVNMDFQVNLCTTFRFGQYATGSSVSDADGNHYIWAVVKGNSPSLIRAVEHKMLRDAGSRHAIPAPLQISTFVPAAAGGTDNLTADDVQSTSEVTSPSVGQTHALTNTSVESASEVTSPSVGQAHALTATSVESTSEVSAPAVGESNLLTAVSVESASEVSTPALTHIHVLTAVSAESASEVSAPAVGQTHVLNADDVQSQSQVSVPAIDGVVGTGAGRAGRLSLGLRIS